ncbi:MAG: CYCXC family (seleno)protein [Bryocella sp.]
MKRTVGSILLVSLITIAASAQLYSSRVSPSADIPAHHERTPTTRQPAILSGQQLTGPNFSHAYQVTAYKLAARVGAVLYQQPCYCRCDRTMGHTSLHSCFEGLHGPECSTCMKEGVYTYRETRKGKTPAQIRSGIERGEFLNVDLETLHS